LPATPATFMTSMAVWFQSVTVSARAVDVAKVMSTPIAIAVDRCMMLSWLCEAKLGQRIRRGDENECEPAHAAV
jgi:hypothetical protein